MPILINPKHEIFAQELAKGEPTSRAYVIAGYCSNRSNANKLRIKEHISLRVNELLGVRENREVVATERAIQRLSVTKEQVLAELVKIGFADITKAVEWGAALAVQTAPDASGAAGEPLLVQGVALKASKDLPPEVSAAIAEVRKTKDGISIKFHDKQAALVSLGRHMGLFIERHEIGEPGAFARMSDDELDSDLIEQAKALGLPVAAIRRMLSSPDGETSH